MEIVLKRLVLSFVIFCALRAFAQEQRPEIIAISSSHVLYISHEHEVKSAGEGCRGALGHTEKSDHLENTFRTIELLKGKHPRTLAAGKSFSLVLCADGALYSFGDFYHASLGRPSVGHHIPSHWQPGKIKALKTKEILQIAAGRAHALALARDGSVYFWGKRFYADPCEIVSLRSKRIKRVVAGDNASFAIDEDHNLWSIKSDIGYTKWKASHENPVKINELGELQETVQDVAAGYGHVIILTMNGSVFSYGPNWCGQLGHEENETVYLPKKIAGLQDLRIIKVVAGRKFSAALTHDGEIWWWGRLPINDSSDKHIEFQPKKFDQLGNQRASDIVAGHGARVLGVVSEGSLLFYGMFKHKYCKCIGPSTKRFSLAPVSDLYQGRWSKEHHLRHNKSIRDAVVTMLLLNRFRFNPQLPEDVLLLILGYLS